MGQVLPCRPAHLPLFEKPPAGRRSLVFEQDVIYVSGGSNRNLLAPWREWGLDATLRDAREAGIGEPDRRPAYRRLVQEGRLGSGYAADDGAALHFAGPDLAGVVTSRPAARAYRIEMTGGVVHETPLAARYLTEPLGTLTPRTCYAGLGRHPRAHCEWPIEKPGRSSHVRPSSSLPRDFAVGPPHCLKKKGTPWARH